MFKVIPYGCNNSEWVNSYSVFNGIPTSEVVLYFYDSLGNKKKEVRCAT